MQSDVPRIVYFLIAGVMVVGTGWLVVRLVNYSATHGPNVWFFAAGTAAVLFLVGGPIAWGVRVRVPVDRRRELKPRFQRVLLVIAVLVAYLLAINLPDTEWTDTVVEAVMLGYFLSFGLVVLVERLVVPDSLRLPGNRTG
ncbi:hypothetical protein [Halovivax cerinus]|uniref:Uncharacterized protein n=1 Tax=Halovivax cerinus TaxID=1487865 RepID=A0ABD5NRJ4_9EURY|nr:hypothetical protein [Halovivax cerinus]